MSEHDNEKEMTEWNIVRFPCAIEITINLLIQIFGLCFVYWIFKEMGIRLIGDHFSPDMLLSLVVLPAIYILRDSHIILDPFFVSVFLNEKVVTVKRGILTRSEDSLNLRNVENIEVIIPFFGRFMNYGYLNVYAYGSWVEIPYVKDVPKLKAYIENTSKNK